jgi:hypothetical protein
MVFIGSPCIFFFKKNHTHKQYSPSMDYKVKCIEYDLKTRCYKESCTCFCKYDTCKQYCLPMDYKAKFIEYNLKLDVKLGLMGKLVVVPFNI